MATTFLEPGGDATFQAVSVTGFWANAFQVAIATDFVHGTHVKSLKYNVGFASRVRTPTGVVSDAGGRFSYYLYLVAYPASASSIVSVEKSANSGTFYLGLTTGGILRVFKTNAGTQLGTDGPTLNLSQWYRISVAYTLTSTTINRIEVFVDGVSAISITNATLTQVGSTDIQWGNDNADASLNMRTSDHYIDNSSSLTDPGNIWVTAKRPFSNGTNNQFTTQIGAGGSGYGSGHSPQVNERPLSNTNGWSIQNAAKQTEEYSIEAKSVGDIDISTATIVDFLGWVDCKVGVNSTGNIIIAGSASNISVTTTETLFTKIAGSTTYPAGNTDIGMDTNTINQLFSLYECGVIVAFIPSTSIAYTLSVTAGTFVLTGITAFFIQALHLVLTTGSFVVTGISLSFKRGYNFILNVGTYILTGYPLSQNQTTRLTRWLALRKIK